MSKYMLAFFAIVLATMESGVAGQYYGYGQQQGGYGQSYPMTPGGQSCSKSYLFNKYQKNLLESQQEMAACRQGNSDYCQKAQKDYQDAQKYWVQYNNCPYP